MLEAGHATEDTVRRHDRYADNRRVWTCNYSHIYSERKMKKNGCFGSKLIR
jgi:hypothetical protein